MNRGASRYLGAILLLMGVMALASLLVGFHLPVLRTTAGIFLIYVGLKVLMGRAFPPDRRSGAFFSSTQFCPGNSDPLPPAYNVVFGRAVVDLSAFQTPGFDCLVEINTIFGETEVLVGPSLSVEASLSSLAGSVMLPTPSLGSDAGRLRLDINVVFGSVHVRRISPSADS